MLQCKEINIEFKEMRDEFKLTIKELSDPKYYSSWIFPGQDDGFWYKLIMILDILIDSNSLEDYPMDQIGGFLRGTEEVIESIKLITIFQCLVKTIGIEKKDSDYLNHPLWTMLVQQAQKLDAVLSAPDSEDEDPA